MQISILVFILLLFWLLISGINQFFPAFTKKYTFFALPVRWRFFISESTKNDCYLLYRDISDHGFYSPWTEITPEIKYRLKNNFWNPDIYQHKAFQDIVTDYIEKSRVKKNTDEPLAAYECLLNFVREQMHTTGSIQTQFLVMRKRGIHKKPECVFISDLHSLTIPNSKT